MNNVSTGTRGRTAPQRLDRRLEEEEDDADLFGLSRTTFTASDSDTDHFVINTEPVGEILAVSIAVRHRHLTDEWYLRYVVLSDPERTRTRHFPCHNVVLSKATLRPGEGIVCTIVLTCLTFTSLAGRKHHRHPQMFFL